MEHAHGDGPAPGIDVEALFHTHGLRVTSQRRRVVAALAAGEHLTPDQVIAAVADDGGDPLPPSTVYRALDTLEELGVITHTHLTHGAPTYHLADRATHLHLVCRRCNGVESVPAAMADAFSASLRDAVGFRADVVHMGIHGICARCADQAAEPHGSDQPDYGGAARHRHP